MKHRIARFFKSEDGSILHFTLIVFLAFLAAAGMGADFMRHELYRADLQNSLDRGVLAATAFSQQQDPDDVIAEFVQESEKWRGTNTLPTVQVQRTPNDQTWFSGPVTARSVTASANAELNTHFLRFVGIDTLPVRASSTAAQTRNPVEIVMVLDISASMDSDDASTKDARIKGLRTSAKLFVDKVLTSETKDLTSVTLVPFGGSVNPGDFLPYLNVETGELPSWAEDGTSQFPVCPQFEVADMSGADIANVDYGRTYQTNRIFKRYKSAFPGQTGDIRWSWCPEPDAGIVALSNNADALKTRIDSMGLYDGTGIDIGLKWGLHALSPDARPVVNSLVSGGEVNSNFSGWPHSFTEDGVEKYIVFLTDGGITEQFDLKDDIWDGTVEELRERNVEEDDAFASAEDRDKIADHIASFVTETGRLADYWSMPNSNFFDIPASTVQNRDNVMRGGGALTAGDADKSYITGVQETRWDKSQALQNVENLCDFTKNVRPDGNPFVRVFTIGFDLDNIDFDTYVPPATAADAVVREDQITFVLDHCATFDEDRYLATSENLDEAFEDIVSQINRLRLTN